MLATLFNTANPDGLGSLGDFNSDDFQPVCSPAVTKDFCERVIHGQSSANVSEQFACASQGWIGNQPYITSQTPLPPVVAATQQVPIPPLAPVIPSIASPLIVEPVEYPQAPTCGGFAGWVNDNPLLAVTCLVALAFVGKGGR